MRPKIWFSKNLIQDIACLDENTGFSAIRVILRDNLSINFDLTDKQIAKSYEMHKKQKRLQKYLDKK